MYENKWLFAGISMSNVVAYFLLFQTVRERFVRKGLMDSK